MAGRPQHVPLRRCAGCRRRRPQRELLRLHQDAAGVWQLDPARRAGGRGTWVCADAPGCWTPKQLGRTFRAQTERVRALLQGHAARNQNQDQNRQHEAITRASAHTPEG